MKYKHISRRYLSDSGTLWTLSDLLKLFDEFKTKRPQIYKDFREWIDNMTETGLLMPI